MAEEAEERISRYRTLTGAVFGLALGLSAFSLVEFPIHGLFDIMIALIVFANLFTIILGIWHDVHRMLKYPFGMLFALLIYMLIFLVALMPFTFRLIFKMGEAIEILARLYPLNVVASQVVLAIMYQSFIRHNSDSLPKEMILWGKESRNCILIVAVFYTASFFLPSEVKFLPLPPDFPLSMHAFLQRLCLWSLAWPIMIIYGVIYEKVHGIKWASR